MAETKARVRIYNEKGSTLREIAQELNGAGQTIRSRIEVYMSLSRTPPIDVRRHLRKEVGYGCPVQGCRKPMLTWHHFDPPWSEKHHHDPAGMIALCREHHDAADAGVFSREQLHALKKAPHSVDDVRAQFPWAKRNLLVRLGGVYCGDVSNVLNIGENSIISLSKDANGLLVLSCVLTSADGKPVFVVEENMFEADPSGLHDLEINLSATRVTVWLANRDIGMDLSFRRITVDELGTILAKDREKAETTKGQVMPTSAEIETRFPPEMRAMIEEARRTPPSWLESLPPHLRELHVSDDPVGTQVRNWAKANCQDDEQRIPFLDFRRMKVCCDGKYIVIRDGLRLVSGGIFYSASFDNKGGAIRL
jgi:hypothetical protein